MTKPKIKAPVQFTDNKITSGKEGAYRVEEVLVGKVLESWKFSLFSFEWLTPDGDMRDLSDLPDLEQEKYQKIMLQLSRNEPLERPVLGIGVMDNIEIGSRRDIFLTLAKQGYTKLSVHIPAANLKEFTPYL